MESETQTDEPSSSFSSIDLQNTVEFPPLSSNPTLPSPPRKWGPPPKTPWSVGPFAKRALSECHAALSRHKLSRDELRDNGYAMMVPNTEHLVHIKEPIYYKDNRLVIKSGSRRRVCCRCNWQFNLVGPNFENPRLECAFHLRPVYDKIEQQRVFPCCTFQTDNVVLKALHITGCYHNTFHVFHHIYDTDLNKFIRFPESSGLEDPRRSAVYALDCEMVYTSNGPALARLSLIDLFGSVVIDVMVRPEGEIYDTNKTYSGLTIEEVQNATETLETVHAKLFKLISRDSILIGHSLEADLRALRLVHENIVDTAVMFRHFNQKIALRELASQFLNRDIQLRPNGHDSIEDAMTCVQLVAYKLDCDESAHVFHEFRSV